MRKRRGTQRRRRAATGDVLGTLRRPQRVPARWHQHHRRLHELLQNLLRRQGSLARDAQEEKPNFSTHMADAGTDAYDRDFALGLLSSEQDAVYEIEQALNRIQNGTYGICELTGKKIEPERLEAVPWTRFTAAAERQLENEGAIKHARLGPRDTVPKTEATLDSETE